MSARPERLLVAAAATAGCFGVAVSAAASHGGGGPGLETAGRFLLFHAPALLGLAAASRTGLLHRPTGLAAGALLVSGLVLFSGDLSIRAVYGVALFRMSAPLGGIALMAGWAVLAASTVIGGRESRRTLP